MIKKLDRLTDEVRDGLRGSMNDDEPYFEHAINTGKAELWEVDKNSYMITRLEVDPGQRPTLVVCCYGGENVLKACELMLDICKKGDYRGLRFHTRRPALARLLKKFEFAEIEQVFFWSNKK